MPKRKNERKNKSQGQKADPSVSDCGQAESELNPIGLLLKMAVDENVETRDGQEMQVDNAREAGDTLLLTRSELERYAEYKRQWQEALARPQESLDALALRERQIIEAAKNHDWEALDRLQKEVEDDLLRLQYVYASMGLDTES
jgi:hypothetical protein